MHIERPLLLLHRQRDPAQRWLQVSPPQGLPECALAVAPLRPDVELLKHRGRGGGYKGGRRVVAMSDSLEHKGSIARGRVVAKEKARITCE